MLISYAQIIIYSLFNYQYLQISTLSIYDFGVLLEVEKKMKINLTQMKELIVSAKFLSYEQ